jgi:predicted nuclease of predicted toxin-antitoxin system
MRIKLDENLPAVLSVVLARLGHDVHTLADENLSGASDSVVWEAAQHEARLLITQDLDFSDLRRVTPGTHHRILLVRLGNADRESLILYVDALFQTEEVDSWAKCFVVVTEHKVRVVRSPG